MCQEAKKFKSKHENLQCHVFKLMLVSCTEWNVFCFFLNKSPPLTFTEGQLPAIRHYFESLNWLQVIHEQPWCWKSAVWPISNRSVPEKAPLIVVYQCIRGPCTMKQLQHTEDIFLFCRFKSFFMVQAFSTDHPFHPSIYSSFNTIR